MKTHRLERLARLTQGAALVSLGALSFACNDTSKHVNNPPEEPIHVNATATPTLLDAAPPPSDTAAVADAGGAPVTSASATLRTVPHTMNAMPRPRPSTPDVTGVSH